MAEQIKFTQLPNVGDLTASAIIALAQAQGGDYASYGASLAQVAELLNKGISYEELPTEAKDILGAITEIYNSGGGGGGSNVKMKDNPNGGVDLTVDGLLRTLALQGSGGGGEGFKLEKLFDATALGSLPNTNVVFDISDISEYDNLIFLCTIQFNYSRESKPTAIYSTPVDIFSKGDVYEIFGYSTRYCSFQYMDNTHIKCTGSAGEDSSSRFSVYQIYGIKYGGTGGGSSVTMSDNTEGGVDLTVDDETRTLATEAEVSDVQADLTELREDLMQLGDYVSGSNVYNGIFTPNKNLEGNGSLTDHLSRGVTDFIKVEPNKTYYVYMGQSQVKVNFVRCLQYNRDKTLISGSAITNNNNITILSNASFIRMGVAMDYLNNLFFVGENATGGQYEPYDDKRFEAYVTREYVDERITELTNNYSIPSYWSEYLKERVNTIRTSMTDGIDTSVFFIQSDTHYNGVGLQDINPSIPKYLADKLNIHSFIHLGDLVNSANSDIRGKTNDIKRKLDSVCNRVMYVRGNHDDNGYQSDYNKVIPQSESYSLLLRGENVIFGGDGTYYYFDNDNEKLRYIGLNGCDNVYEESNGRLKEKNNAFGVAQLQWLCDVLTNVKNGYGVIIFEHTMLSKSICTEENPNTSPQTWSRNVFSVIDILNAYKNKSRLNNYSVDGKLWNGSDYSGYYSSYYVGTINADFTQSNGELICVLSGHEHMDTITTIKTKSGIDTGIINTCIQNSSFNFDEGTVNRPYQATMELGTINECVYDIVVVNKKNRNVKMFRIGTGKTQQREFNY